MSRPVVSASAAVRSPMTAEQQQRQQQRAAIRRNLFAARYALSTQRKYNAELAAFLIWAATEGYRARKLGDLDNVLADYICDIFDDYGGKGKSKPRAALSGICMYHPEVAHLFPISRALLAGFDKQQPSVPYPPISWALTSVLAVYMADAYTFRHGVAAVLAFHCLLRVGELCRLVREDIIMPIPGDPDAPHMQVLIRFAKTGKNQWVRVLHPGVVELLVALRTITRPNRELFSFSPQTFRTAMHTVCARIGLSTSYVPHSFRHGGATQLYQQDVKMADIMKRGRWKAQKSAEGYIQDGAAMLARAQVSPVLHARGVAFGRDIAFSLLRYRSGTS